MTRRFFLEGLFTSGAAAAVPADAVAAVGNLAGLRQSKEQDMFLALLGRLDEVRRGDRDYLHLLEKKAAGLRSMLDAYRVVSETDREFVHKITGKTVDAIAKSPNEFVAIWRNPAMRPLARLILDGFKQLALSQPVLDMNELHDRVAGQRLSVIRDLKARTLYEIMAIGGSDAYLSTVQLLYNGKIGAMPESQLAFLPKVKREHGSFKAFLGSASLDKESFGSVLELLAQNGLLDSFLSDIGTAEDQKEVLSRFLFDESLAITERQAITLNELLHATRNNSVLEFVLQGIRRSYDTGGAQARKVAALLLTEYFRSGTPPEWAVPIVAEYARYFPAAREFDTNRAFMRVAGKEICTQNHFFYDDRAEGKLPSTWDGHLSFKHFVESVGGSVIWDRNGTIQRVTGGKGTVIVDNGDYITVHKSDPKSRREIVIYANKPDRDDGTVRKVHEELIKATPPQVVMHRGHSFHAGKTLQLVTSKVALVNLGSCGGAKRIAEVLERAPQAQIVATQRIGSMLVNDPVLDAINKSLLTTGRVNWSALRSMLDAEFARRGGEPNERWQEYRLPDQNRIAHLVSAMKSATV